MMTEMRHPPGVAAALSIMSAANKKGAPGSQAALGAMKYASFV
jgi:hypothetical protein